MGKYARYQPKSPGKREMNPIWRGIGCILMIVVPALAFGLMKVIVPPIIATGKVPYQILGYVHFPEWIFHYRILAVPASLIGSINNLWMNIITFFVILLLLTAVTSLVYTMIYSLIGPARYSDVDAPPSKHKGKEYTR